jgi:16S rRNA (adenine1518-N6/adenine1519-N6)-dimethyltransferase
VKERDSFAAYRARLAAMGFRPSKALGQNFLLQPELHRLIADAAGLTEHDVVLEIGAGLGFLTGELAARAHRVIAVEIDDRLCRILAQEQEKWRGGERVRLVHTDVLGTAGRLAPAVLEALAAANRRPLRVVANVPYAITGPLLAALCTGPTLALTMALLIPRDVADRLAAQPGQPAWGSLSVLVQACYRLRIVRTVGREVFRPRPNIDSAIVALTKLETGLALASGSDRASFAAFVRALFGGRRKKARHSFLAAARAAGVKTPPAAAHALLEQRPAALGVADLIALWQHAGATETRQSADRS